MAPMRSKSVNGERFYAITVRETSERTILVAVPTEEIGVHKNHAAYRDSVINGFSRSKVTCECGYTTNAVDVTTITEVISWAELIPDSSLSAAFGLASPWASDDTDKEDGGNGNEID